MELKTFDEWRKEGKYVIKGQHACYKEKGKCYFNEKQVITLEELRAYNKALHEKQINKLKRDREIYRKCNKPEWHDAERRTKDETLEWLAYQGSSIYNENCDPFDGIGVSDVYSMLFDYNE